MFPEFSEDYVYLDYAATAPLCHAAAKAMEPYFVDGPANLAAGGNANSLHAPGRAAFAALEQARRDIAHDVGARRPDEIVFTGGATEADCAAVLGMAHAATAERRRRGARDFTPRIVTSAIEHDAVLKPARRLEQEGYRVTRLAPNRQGFVEPAALAAALDEDTVLVSIQAANSEVGSVQQVAEMARLAHAAGALMHVDAVQALGKIPVDVGAWDVDAASFSAHKIGGPKGVGALYLKARTPFEAQMLGGGQEAGRRSGTQNVAGAVGFAAACRWACEPSPSGDGSPRWSASLRFLRDSLYEELAQIEGVEPTVEVPAGSLDYLPNIVNVLVRGMESETLILRLDQRGFGVSGGSACSSRSLDPSHVLLAMGVSADRALGALRVSMGADTQQWQVKAFVRALREVVA